MPGLRKRKRRSGGASGVRGGGRAGGTSKSKKGTTPKKNKKTTASKKEEEEERVKEKVVDREEAKKKAASLDFLDHEWEIRLGAFEIVAVYTEQKVKKKTHPPQRKSPRRKTTRAKKETAPAAVEEEEEPVKRRYDFARLCDDVLFGDSDAEQIKVEWLDVEIDDEHGNVEVLVPPDLIIHDEEDDEEQEPESIAIGAVICAVTDKLAERRDGSFEVIDETHKFVNERLDWQLSDEYDPKKDEEDGGGYEERMRKRYKRKVKDVPKGKKKRGGDEEDGGEPKKKRRKKETKKASNASSAKTPTRTLTPRPSLPLQLDIFHTKTSKLNAYNGDTHRASKESIRALLSSDTNAWKKIFKDRAIIADVFVARSCDVGLNVLDYALLAERKDAVKALYKELDNVGSNGRPNFPDCTLVQLSSGRHTSSYADYNRRQVGASRGGLEGNNAFVDDMVGSRGYGSKRSHKPGKACLLELLETNDAVSVPFLEWLDKEFFGGSMVDWNFDFHKLVTSGHLALAHHATKLLLDKGVGLNQLHVDVLESVPSGKTKTLDTFRAVSVVKLTQNGVRFCPVHCAASNPNPTFLQQLLNVSPDAVDMMDSDEGTVLHYASVGERSDTLRWLLDGPGSKLARNAKLRKGDKTTPLMWAARACQAENVCALCENQTFDDLKKMFTTFDASGKTALHIVCCSSRSGRFDTARALLECGVDPDVKGDTRLLNKLTPLHICAQRGDLDLMQILLEGGGDLLTLDKLNRNLAMLASKNGHVHVLSYLLRAGLDPEEKDSSGNTAMHYAAAYGWVECLKLLLSVNANADVWNSWSSTPLALALKKGRYACAVVLLNLTDKVDVNVCDKTGLSLFGSLVDSYMSQLQNNPDAPLPWAIGKMIERADLDVTSADAAGKTVLHYIANASLSPSTSSSSSSSGGEAAGKAAKTALALVEKILDLGADPLVKDKAGAVPAKLALQKKNAHLASLLLGHASHASVELDDENLLHLLIKNVGWWDSEVFLKMFDTLEQCNAEWLREVNREGMTPLLLCADLVRRGWNERLNYPGKNEDAKKCLEGLVERLATTGRLADTLQPRPEFRHGKWPSHRIVDGVPDWTPSDEYAEGSRTILHALVRCRELVWVNDQCRTVLKSMTDGKALLNLKGNDGMDVVGYAVDTFVGRGITNVSVQPTLELLKLLRNAGADMNGVTHPLFSSLDEARNGSDGEDVAPDLSDEDSRLANARLYVLHRERKRIREMLADKERMGSLESQFQPRLERILLSSARHGNDASSFDGLLQGMLADCGFSPNVRDLNGNTALHVAVRNGIPPETVSQLIPWSDVNALNDAGESPLILAVGNIVITKLLIDHGADVDYVAPKSGTALHQAVWKQDEELVDLLLKTCSVDKPDSNGRIALHCAVAIGAVNKRETLNPIEMQLLKAGANVNATDARGRTPLHYVFIPIDTDTRCTFPPVRDAHDPIDMLTTLSGQTGIKLDVADEDRKTPLHYAAAVGASICVLYLCENSPHSMSAVDEDGNTPLALALRARRADTAVLLISKGSELDVMVTAVGRNRDKKDKDKVVETGRTVHSTLWHALSSPGPCESVARYMLAAKKLSMNTILSALFETENFQLGMQQIKSCPSRDELSARDNDGETALHRLAKVKSFASGPAFAVALADVLIDNGVDPSAVGTSSGKTAVHLAASHGHTNLIRHLIDKHGVAVDVVDKDGETPLGCAFGGHRGVTLELFCILANASKDARAFVNGSVQGKRKRTDEEKWKSFADVETKLLEAPVEKTHTEEALVERSKAPRKKLKRVDSYTIASTFLIEAVRCRDAALVNAILSYGGDGGTCDKDGRTALHHAVLTDQPSVLSILLSWGPRGNVQTDALDGEGQSALGYAVLASLQNDNGTNLCAKLLLGYGANPLSGKALHYAIRYNSEKLAMAMVKCVNSAPSESSASEGTKYQAGDSVWVRYGGKSVTWRMATVAGVDGQKLAVLPGHIRHDLPLKEEAQQRAWLVEDVADAWVCVVDKSLDVPEKVEDVLVSLVKDTSMSEGDKRSLVREFEGYEVGLRDMLTPDAAVDALTSKLDVGDAVGYHVASGAQEGVLMHVGTVKVAHPNGQYDIELLRGFEKNQVSRTRLRPLRKELHVSNHTTSHNQLTSDLVHACVRPFCFGSYENMALLRALVSAGTPVDGKDGSGLTPFEAARPGSEMKEYLRQCSPLSEDGSERMASTAATAPVVPPAEGIDLAADADAALASLHSSGADVTEPIIPDVSPVCELDSAGVTVLADYDGSYFDVALTKVDVMNGRYGKYVFYKMQIIHDPIQKTYVLLTNWGRIGEDGKFQQTPFNNRQKCEAEFGKVFKSKSGNKWSERSSFRRVSGKYNLVQRPRTRVKHPEKLLREVVESEAHPCSLPSEVATVLRCLLDVKALTAAVSRCNFDQDRLPFGQLSLSTVQAAEAKLGEIKTALEKKEKMPESCSVSEFRSALELVARLSSEFYELLPMGDEIVRPFELNNHSFGKAMDLISLLRDLTITKQLLLGAMQHQATMNPIDYAYKALQVGVAPLPPDSMERKCLQRYIDNTCNSDDVIVHQIYALDDGREASDIPNKRLLFHGSKNENILGIMKHGLLIAPPAALTTGWMYGKGVYFADQFSKSFGYSDGFGNQDSTQPRSFVFVAEVALGDSYTPSGAEYMEKSPEGTQSTHAVGAQEPDPKLNLTLDETGATVPLGGLQASNVPGGAKGVWKYNRWNYLNDEACMRIEKVRQDPNTEFPASVRISLGQQEQLVKLKHGPQSQKGTMEEIAKEDETKEEKERGKNDDEMEVDEDKEEGNNNAEGGLFDDSDDDEDVRIHVQDNKGKSVKELTREERNNRRGGRGFSEFIVYDTKQIRLKYLIEVTSATWLKQFKLKNDEGKPLSAGRSHNTGFIRPQRRSHNDNLFGDSDDDSDDSY